MCRRLDLMPDQGMEDEPVEHILVAKTTMAFNNAEIIHLLRARGAAIKAEKWDLQAKLEGEINSLKNEKLETLTTPCSVFMTFENEEGITRALKYDEAVEANPTELGQFATWFGDEKIEIQPASEPSDIIWENRHFTPRQRLLKEIVVFLILGVLLALSFWIVFALSTYSYQMLNKFPVTDCPAFTEGKGDTFMQIGAWSEYEMNTNMEKQGKEVSYSGYVQCFCDAQ